MGPAEPAPAVRLCREWKGLTAADLLRDEVVERLPGRVLGALQHLRRGDLAAADRALPDVAPPLLAGPGSERRASGLVAFLVVVLCAVAALVAAMFR